MVYLINCFAVGEEESVFSVVLEKWKTVALLKVAIADMLKYTGRADKLVLYLGKEGHLWLTEDQAAAVVCDNLGHPQGFKEMNKPLQFLKNPENFGESFQPCENQVHVLVKLPEDAASHSPSVGIPRTTTLNEPEKYAEECIALDDWDVDGVHKIPLIWEFMSSLGGCTNTGELFWRLEDKQVASLLLDGWFRASSPGSINEFANMKSILIGSLGIGKSTLLCVMAFYLVFKRKKNVLVYRRLTETQEENCLLYLGYEEDKVVYFTVKRCKADRAVNIYEELGNRQGFPNVWLLLDGFRYEDIPEGVRTFRMLATSQQVDLKSQEQTNAYCCLLPCWSKKDLLSMGDLIYKFTPDDMEERFYYSGGSVREFTYDTWEHISRVMDNAVSAVEDYSKILSTASSTFTDRSQANRLRRTFVEKTTDRNHYLTRRHWKQMIDSEYAVLGLSVRLKAEALLGIYMWAKNTGHGSLAGCAFEIYLHRLASDNRLTLFKSEYDLNQPQHFKGKQVTLRTGGAFCSGTSNDYEKDLVAWRDNEQLTYWYPECDDFPNIDSIVKLESTSGKKSNVAYLHFTIARKHDIDEKQLKEMNKIFFPDHVKNAGETDAPIYIAVCPDEESCRKFVLDARVVAARQVFVGYYRETAFANGPTNRVALKVRPPSPFKTRKRLRME